MSALDETTPLTSPFRQSFEDVSSRGIFSRFRYCKSHCNQWYFGVTLILILLAASLAAWVMTDLYADKTSPAIILANKDTNLSGNMSWDAIGLLMDEPSADWALNGIQITPGQREEAVNAGIKALGDREILEESMQPTPVHSASYRHYRSLSTNPEARKYGRHGYVENHATIELAEMHNYTKLLGRSNIGVGPPIQLPIASLNVSCANLSSRYRRANGTCNNRKHPRYGAAMVPFRRMVAPDYADGITSPRASHNSQNISLPSARDVSLKIHRASYEVDSNFTVMLAVFGQFLDHDITATSLTSSQEGESIDCCSALINQQQHPECFPVLIQPDDPYFAKFNISCMNFVRSAPAPTGYFGPRQQLNQATAFIDGSMVYGNSDQEHLHLRELQNGTLRMFITPDGRELLPISTNPDDGCNRAQMLKENKYCFESGDSRANENLLLTSMHLLWARHHNYLARGLHAANPTWDDERLFQEARKILSAQVAHIGYNEFLPILLGRDLMARRGLLPNFNATAPDPYDSHVNPTVANSFASAAFRFAHTLLPGLFNATRDRNNPESFELHKMLFNPFSLWKSQGIDNALMTAANTPVLHVNRFFSLEITQKLFEGTKDDVKPICGLDLVSLNIQRGRDHGLPSYPVFRRHCHLPPTDTWEQMGNAIDAETLKSIQEIYSSPFDVDVYTGALSERPLEGAIFGPLLTCIVSDQFLRLKIGDSHWYERSMGLQRFSKEQLQEIYKTSLAQIICINSDAIQEVPKHVMKRLNEETNAHVNCSALDSLNFTAWQEKGPHKATFQLHKVAVSSPVSLVTIVEKMSPANVIISKDPRKSKAKGI